MFHISENATVKFLPHKLHRPPCSCHQKNDIKMCENAVATATNARTKFHKNLFSRSRSETHAQTRPSVNQLCCTIRKEPPITTKYFAYTLETAPVMFINCWLLTAPRVPQERRSRPAVCLLHKRVELQNAISAALKTKTKLRGLSPRANYTERAAAAGRRS